VGFVVDKVVLGQVFSGYFGFPCQFSFHRLPHDHQRHLSSGVGTISQIVADVPSGLSLTPTQENKKRVKVRLSLCLIKHQTMKTCGGVAPAFLTFALDSGDFSNSRPGHE
jgi:hypothetical protein